MRTIQAGSVLAPKPVEKEFPGSRISQEEEKTILVVDDEEDLLSMLSDFLKLRGYEVEVARDSRQALSLVHDRPFNVILSDLRMPGMNGVDLLEEVLDSYPGIVFIIMTGYATVQSAVDALKKGAYDYIVKPFSLHELEKTIRLGLDRQRLARENLELSQLMKKLVEIDQIKSNVISSVSHEFRTPLTSLKGYLNMLFQASNNKELNDPSTQEKWLRGMKVNLDRLESLILNLLVMTEASAGDLLIAEEEIELGELLKEILDSLDPNIRNKALSVSLDETTRSRVYADREKMKLAIRNLLENAIKFNVESGAVAVRIEETSDPPGIRISISDTGIGIPAHKIRNIFESFHQLDMTHTRRFAGAGLGLPVAKAIVEAHGGSIDVESKPGKGSTVVVWLPKRRE